MKKAAIYARVENPEEHIDDQLRDLRKLAAQRSCDVVAEYTDIVSGAKVRRPGLDALMKGARKREFDIVIVAGFDILAQSTKHFLQVVNELGGLDIEFVSCREGFDTGGAMGGSLLFALGNILALESNLNKERIRAGLRRRKLEGFKLGRHPLNVNHGALVRDRLSGMSLTDTARKYGVSRASVVRFVREHQKQFAGVQFQHDSNITAVECVA
jgi:DNA invertase Pin-like site-specific DNA recombinase